MQNFVRGDRPKSCPSRKYHHNIFEVVELFMSETANELGRLAIGLHVSTPLHWLSY